MTDGRQHFDEDTGFAVGPRFADDLGELFTPREPIPAYIDRAVAAQAHRRFSRPRRIVVSLRWAAGVAAACLAVAVLGWWVMSICQDPATGAKGPIASSGDRTPLAIELLGGSPITPGTVIRTSTTETRRLVLNGEHQVVMNGSTRLSIELIVAEGRTGCQINLALGEVYVHVEHDGNPFVVQTAHGRAVITGTTFDVKATEAGTTLVVAEGSVRFESQAGAVQVRAGEQSRIAASGAPSPPAACEAAALIAWARPVPDTRESILPTLDEFPTLPVATISTDFESLDYDEWVEENRDWFGREFPDIFRLKDALVQQGVELDYPDLLLESGLAWQFAWPPASRDRLLRPDDEAVITVATHHGKDRQWLEAKNLLHGTPGPTAERFSGAEAFRVWQKELAAVLEADEAVPAELLFGSIHACDYLRRTRSLVWLAVNAGEYSVPDMPDFQLQDLLQQEVAAVDDSTNACLQLLLAEKPNTSCDGDAYQQLVEDLHSAIAKAAETERRIPDERARHHP